MIDAAQQHNVLLSPLALPVVSATLMDALPRDPMRWGCAGGDQLRYRARHKRRRNHFREKRVCLPLACVPRACVSGCLVPFLLMAVAVAVANRRWTDGEGNYANFTFALL